MAGFGLRPVDNLRQPGSIGRVRRYFVKAGDSVILGIGDPVKTDGTQGCDTVTGLPAVTRAAAGDAIRGVVIGVDQVDGLSFSALNLSRSYRPASTAMYLLVADDPDTIFEIQEDNSATFTAAMVGENVDLATVGNADTTTGVSTVEASTTSHATASAQLRILGVPRVDINNPIQVNCTISVLINEHELKSTTGV